MWVRSAPYTVGISLAEIYFGKSAILLTLTPHSTRIFAALHARHFKRTTISVKELHVQKLHMFRIVIETGSKISRRSGVRSGYDQRDVYKHLPRQQ